MNLADNAQVVGESFVGRKCVEISELGIDVELQQERHLGVFGSLPDDHSISDNARRLPVCAATDAGCAEVLAESVTGCGVFNAAFAAGTEASAVVGGTIGWPAIDTSVAASPVKPSLQTVDLFEQYLLLLLHLAKQFSDRGVLRLHGLDFAVAGRLAWGPQPRPCSLHCLVWVPRDGGRAVWPGCRRLSEGRSREQRN